MRAAVLSAGQVRDYDRVRAFLGTPELVICADGGIRHAQAMGLTPDLVVGDFDSADQAEVAALEQRGVSIQRVPVEKDETDTHLALEEAVRRGATEVVLVGAVGDRLDHTVANLLLLPGLPEGVSVTVVDGKNAIHLLRPGGRLTVPRAPGEYLSLLPLTPEVTGVVAEGVKWPLRDATLTWGSSLGVSNEILEPEARIAIRDGYLLVIRARD